MKEPKGVHGRQSHTHWTEPCQKPTVMGLPGNKTMGVSPQPAPRPFPHFVPHLCIRLIPKGVKDFLDGHNLPGPPIHCLPHNAIGLGRRAVSLLRTSLPAHPPDCPADRLLLRILAVARGRGVVRAVTLGKAPAAAGCQDASIFWRRAMGSKGGGRPGRLGSGARTEG